MHLGIYHGQAGRRHAGGKAVFVREMARHLAADHRVTLYTTTDTSRALGSEATAPTDDRSPTEALRAAGVEVVTVPSVESATLRSVVDRLLPVRPDPLLSVASAVRHGVVSHADRHVDVLLTHRYLDDLVLSNLVDTPVVYQYHNVASVGAGARARERFSEAAVHLANSETIAREVREKLGRTVDGVVYPGVDTDRFAPDADPAPPIATVDGPTVLFVGRVTEGKGIFDLLDALARSAAVGDDHRPTPHCFVAGDGATERVRRRARSLGLGDALALLGEVPHEDLPGYYAAADLCCHPTHYEGFGMTNVEAMACGTPVVSTRVDGVREYATDGRDSVLVDPGDVDALASALDALCADGAGRERLGAAARETAKEYAWSVQADRLVDVCRTALHAGEGADAVAPTAVERQ